MPETSRDRLCCVIGLACLMLLLPGAAVFGQQIDATPVKSEEEVLKGTKALRIIVAEMGPEVGTLGVTREAVEKQAKKTLQEKLPTLKLDPKAITLLYFTVNLAGFQSRLGYYGNLSVEFKRPGMIMVGKDFPDSPVQNFKATLATVWAQNVIFTGEVLAPTAVNKALDGVLDRFAADFRKANP